MRERARFPIRSPPARVCDRSLWPPRRYLVQPPYIVERVSKAPALRCESKAIRTARNPGLLFFIGQSVCYCSSRVVIVCTEWATNSPLRECNNLVHGCSCAESFFGSYKGFSGTASPRDSDAGGLRALIGAYDLQVPLPRRLSGIAERHSFMEQDGWRIYSPRYKPDPSLKGHLTFALKHEGLDLAVLKRLFAATGPTPLADLVKAQPTGAYARRIWFLYEWLTGAQLDLPNASRGVYPLIVDPNQQYAVPAKTSPRHGSRTIYPGTPAFCPLVFRTEALEGFIVADLQARARQAIAASAARSARAHGRLPACQGFEVQLRH